MSIGKKLLGFIIEIAGTGLSKWGHSTLNTAVLVRCIQGTASEH